MEWDDTTCSEKDPNTLKWCSLKSKNQLKNWSEQERNYHEMYSTGRVGLQFQLMGISWDLCLWFGSDRAWSCVSSLSNVRVWQSWVNSSQDFWSEKLTSKRRHHRDDLYRHPHISVFICVFHYHSSLQNLTLSSFKNFNTWVKQVSSFFPLAWWDIWNKLVEWCLSCTLHFVAMRKAPEKEFIHSTQSSVLSRTLKKKLHGVRNMLVKE